jgi:pre-mRNA-processing factor 40
LRIKKENCEAFRTLLETDQVKFNTKWDDVRIQYKNNDVFKSLHPYDRISTFIDYIFDAEKKSDEEVSKERRLRERVNRTNYRTLLKEKLLSGELTYKSKWKEFIL